MNLPAEISVSGASLPRTYQAAQSALAECQQIDECKDWADKAAALASYARQSEDDQLERMAQRIRARAIRRAGELLKQIEPAHGANQNINDGGDTNVLTRKQAAQDAGMSERQRNTAQRIASIPEQDFDEQVEGPKPPTLSQLARQGTKPRQNIVDLQGRDPDEFNLAMHYVGGFERIAKDLEKEPHEKAIPILNEKERQRLRAAIQRIDAITDKTITRI